MTRTASLANERNARSADKGIDFVRVAGDDGEGFEHARSRIGVRVWFALVILLLWRQLEESVRLFFRALTLRTLACALSRLINTHSDCGWLFNPCFPDAGEAEGFTSLEPDGVGLPDPLFALLVE